MDRVFVIARERAPLAIEKTPAEVQLVHKIVQAFVAEHKICQQFVQGVLIYRSGLSLHHAAAPLGRELERLIQCVCIAPGPVEEPVHEVIARASHRVVERQNNPSLFNDSPIVRDSAGDKVHEKGRPLDIAEVGRDELARFLIPPGRNPDTAYEASLNAVPESADRADGRQLRVEHAGEQAP
jgi:hypothetical protein